MPIGGGDLGLTTRFEYEEAFVRGRIDIAQPDVTMAGGITELMRISALAKRWASGSSPMATSRTSRLPPTSPSCRSTGWTSPANIPPASRRCAGI